MLNFEFSRWLLREGKKGLTVAKSNKEENQAIEFAFLCFGSATLVLLLFACAMAIAFLGLFYYTYGTVEAVSRHVCVVPY